MSAISFPFIAILFFMSGAVALFYQLLWIKVLGLHFGHSAWSISTVVAAFMAGLGLGSWQAGRLLKKSPQPILVYGGCEVLIAFYGFLVFPLLQNMTGALGWAYEIPGLFVWVRAIFVFVILLPPTLLMGATLPVLVAAVSTQGSFARVVAVLYGLNTFGSALGALFAGFVLLPKLGLNHANLVTVFCGLVIGALAIKFAPAPHKNIVFHNPQNINSNEPKQKIFLVLAAAIGFIGLFLECAWTRMLTPVLGSSTYTFTLIVTIYLLGTAIGSLIISRLHLDQKNTLGFAGLIMASISVSVAVQPIIVNQMPGLFSILMDKISGNLSFFFLCQALMVSLLVLVPTIGLGMLFPLLVIHYRSDRVVGYEALGHVYAANTVGAIVGALTTGFFLLPYVGLSNAQNVMVLGGLVLTMMLIQLSSWRRVSLPMLWLAVGAVILLVWTYGPRVRQSWLQRGHFRGVLNKKHPFPADANLVFIKDGISSTVTVFRNSRTTFLNINGKPDASTSGDLETQILVGHLPMAMSVNPKRVCVIGYGSGATVAAVAAHPVEQIDVIELEPAVYAARSYFSSVAPGLDSDSRVKLYMEDGRTFLSYSKKSFDVIISEPSNPWIAGIGSLFTADHYARVRKNLNPNGVYCQWIQTYEISLETLHAMLQTFHDHFPHVSIFVSGGDFICLGSEKPLGSSWQHLETMFSNPLIRKSLSMINVQNPYEFMVGYYSSLPEDAAFFPSALRNTDDNSWLEYRAPLEMYRGVSESLRIPEASIVLERVSQRFLRGKSLDQCALGLAEAIARNRPSASNRIRQIEPLVQSSTLKASLQRLFTEAQSRVSNAEKQQRLMAEGWKALSASRFEDAQRQLDDAVFRSHPPQGYFQLKGRVEMALDRTGPAIAAFEQELSLNSFDYESQALLGFLYVLSGRFMEGQKLLEQSFNQNHHYLQAGVFLGEWYRVSDQWEARKELLSTLRKLLPRSQFKDFKNQLKEIAADGIMASAYAKQL